MSVVLLRSVLSSNNKVDDFFMMVVIGPLGLYFTRDACMRRTSFKLVQTWVIRLNNFMQKFLIFSSPWTVNLRLQHSYICTFYDDL